MDEWLETCRKVYNHALAERRDWIKSRKCEINACSIRSEYIMPADAPRITYAGQCKSLRIAKKSAPELKVVHSQVLQQVLNTLEQAFVGMWEQGRGFPRFKKQGRMRSFLFPQFAESPIKGEKIELPKLGRIRIRLHRPIPDGLAVKQARVVNRASGWYVMLSLFCDVVVPDINPHGHPLGIDVGLDAFVATSHGELIDRPRSFVDAQHKLKIRSVCGGVLPRRTSALNRDVTRKLHGSKKSPKSSS